MCVRTGRPASLFGGVRAHYNTQIFGFGSKKAASSKLRGTTARETDLCIMSPGTSMTREIEAVYEHGMIRPLQPLELPDGTRLDLIVITHEQPKTNGNAAQILAEIAALPLEGSADVFAGREHDSILYPRK